MKATDLAKVVAAEKALSYVREGMIVGLGTGSTARYAIEKLSERVEAGLHIQGVPTSQATATLSTQRGIPLVDDFTEIDLTLDGADEVDSRRVLIKGGGGALTREKIVASASRQVIIMVDESKLCERVGRFPLPVEVLPFGWRAAQKKIESLGCTAKLRLVGEVPFVTDNGNYILDCSFGPIDEPTALERELNLIPGVVENGLFIHLASRIIVGKYDGAVEERV